MAAEFADRVSTDLARSVPLKGNAPLAQVFPVLTPAQIARVANHGRTRAVESGELLVQTGDHDVSFFVVTSGTIEIVQPTADGETLIRAHQPGEFTGEMHMLSGRRAMVNARVGRPGEVIELDRRHLLSLVQTDSELSEIVMRAFIFRRQELIAHGLGDVVVIGSNHCAGTLRVKEFLSRNGHPFSYIDLDQEDVVQEMLDQFRIAEEDVPVLICGGTAVLRNPTNEQIADCLALNEDIDPAQLRDLVIIGAGPAGLAAAVYGASEGLDVLVVESNVPGGQAGSSSKIENYLGFPTGVSGQNLTARAHTQAQKFGAQIVVAKGATRLSCERNPYVLEIGTARVPARVVIIATGAQYRKPAIENVAQFEGAGVYYAATHMEAQVCGTEEVIVVGGGNSAGQAAVFLAQSSRRVHVLIRSDGLAASMSRYLIRRIEEDPRIDLRVCTEIVGLEGNGHLERVRWQQKETGEIETRPIRHVFYMTGADPSTRWLPGCIALDEKGFVKTGPALSRDDLSTASWPAGRAPHLLETSMPGVFAVGDVRSGSIKRVASAVGEGSIAIAFVHQVLNG